MHVAVVEQTVENGRMAPSDRGAMESSDERMSQYVLA